MSGGCDLFRVKTVVPETATMSDWDEIKRLAADFQKIQLSSTLQK